MEPEQTVIQDDAIRLAREQFRRTDAAPHIAFEKRPLQPKPLLPMQPLSGSLFRDKDTILLLGLILLLSADGGDRLLILALVYIMS